MKNKTLIENHMKRLAKGYKVWCIPVLMAMWDIGFSSAGSPGTAAKALITQPRFIAVAVWTVALGLVMDFVGRLALERMTDTSNTHQIFYMLNIHSKLALLLTATPVIYYTAKAFTINPFSAGFIADIHGAMTLIAVYDGIKAIKANRTIENELNN